MPRAKGQTSVAKNQMQLAIALSSSLEESKERELSKLTEELPASTIEDGTVPQNIKQMQKEFLERLQMPKPGPSKKSRKPPKPVPVYTLLTRSSEERVRIVTEKVALVLIKDDSHSSSVKNESSLNLQDDWKGSALWGMSWMLSSDKNLYYIDCLATYISPSKVKIGSKSNNTILIPKRLTTPIKYRPGKNAALSPDDSSQSLLYKELEIGLEYCPSYNQSEVDSINSDFQAKLEFQNDWQRMLNNPKLSDITIIVKERSHIAAHKLVLFARCPAILEDLDCNNMITWTTVSHCHATAFLDYLYSGNLTRIQALGEDMEGVVFLARKYKVTELLKFLLISGLSVCTTDTNNCEIALPTCSPCDKVTFKSGTISPDLFADPEETVVCHREEKKAVNNAASSKPLCDPQLSIEISSDDEGDEMLKDFFGTYNPTVCSPVITASFPNKKQTDKTVSEPEPEILNISLDALLEESFHKYDHDGSKPTHSNSLLHKASFSGRCKVQKQYPNDSDSDTKLFSSPEECSRDYQSYVSSPETRKHKKHLTPRKNLLHTGSTSDEDEGLIEAVNTDAITEANPSYSTMQMSPLCDTDSEPSVSSKCTRKSLFQSSKRKFIDGNKSISPNLSPVGRKEESTRILSTPFAKRKQSYTDELNMRSSFTKRRRTLNESVSMLSPRKLTSAPCPEQNQDQRLDDSFNSIITGNSFRSFVSQNGNSPKKRLDLNKSDNNFIFQSPTYPSGNNYENERKLLDDSFNFDVNDSVLLRQTSSMQTPESKPSHLGQLRTPLDNIKTSSPVTPMPDYETMTNDEFEMELLRFGLKRGLTRSKGIKMLTHIYGKLHPLVEVVNLDGKELLIPLGERTPGSNDQQADDEPLSQQSVGSSGDDCIMLEETIFDEDEDLTQGVSPKDLKTAVRAWITSQPEIHEMILSYEPIWLDSFHEELKSKFEKKIKVNQLMDVLDEEGITFRSTQGQQSRRRKKQGSPKKKQASPKKKQNSPKKKQLYSD